MVNEKYLLVAKNLVDRNKNRLNAERSPKEQETDQLFYWIMSRLEWSVQGCWPGKTSHSVTLEVNCLYDDDRVLLRHGRVSEYLSEYVTGEEIYTVMKDVANIFNEIGKSEENGYHFYTTSTFTENTISYSTKLTVHMITKV